MVGKSDYRKDWFLEQVLHVDNLDWLNPAAKDPANQPFGWVKILLVGSPDPWKAWGHGRATTWTIKFNMASTRVSMPRSLSCACKSVVEKAPTGVTSVRQILFTASFKSKS